jgi:pimeloyl-ACP methyl ester carboxylesterase
MRTPLPTPLAYAKPLARVMRRLAAQFPDDGFDIVAHSIGGVMTREVLRQEPDLAGSVHRIVTLGSPHHGTAVVRWIKFGPIYKMLAPDSDYLDSLGTFQDLAPSAIVTTVGSLHDLVVYPDRTCHLEGTRRVTLERISHLGLMTEARAFEEIETALEMAPPLDRSVDLG